MDDPRPALLRATDQIGRLVTPDLDLGAPTPCAGWSVDDLLAHVLAVHHRALRVGPEDRPVDVAHRLPRDCAARYVDDLAAARDELRRTWADDEVLDRMISVPWGTVPGREVGWGYTQELAVHAWDLATALHVTDALDPEVAESVVDVVRVLLPATGREHIPFGEVVEVPDDAGPYERLVGWLGRDPVDPRLTVSR